MISTLLSWKGTVEVDGVAYESSADAFNCDSPLQDNATIVLHPVDSGQVKSCTMVHDIPASTDSMQIGAMYKITVKPYMMKKASAGFDFMSRWNNDLPMPARTMVGLVEKSTRGMVYMSLHMDILSDITPVCMKCGKRLDNKVSQFFGVGPICGHHNYVNPFDSDEELKAAVKEYRQKLQSVTWKGWIIKSAITDIEEVNQ